jgi:hypothetical protein
MVAILAEVACVMPSIGVVGVSSAAPQLGMGRYVR